VYYRRGGDPSPAKHLTLKRKNLYKDQGILCDRTSKDPEVEQKDEGGKMKKKQKRTMGKPDRRS